MEIQTTNLNIAEIDDGAKCCVCARLFALCKMPFDISASVELGKVSVILASECLHSAWVENMRYMYGPVPRYRHRELTAYKDSNDTSVYLGVTYGTRTTSTWSTTQHFELVIQESIDGSIGRSKILHPEWVDEGVVRKWYHCCLEEHAMKCDQPVWVRGTEPVGPEWLIDVFQRRIVPSSEDTKSYTSLSYTWGQTRNLCTTTRNLEKLRQPGAFHSEGDLWNMIPTTIRNAMDITSVLGERFLWVDSLCIVQDDEKALYGSLEKMHMIYANSALCLVAKAGEDANFGLRGFKEISLPREAYQTIVSLEGFRLSGSSAAKNYYCDKPSPSKSGRSYSERAWTFQEFMFAKRRLIFDNGPLRWHCSCAGWHEELDFHAIADFNDAVAPELWYTSRWMHKRVPSLSSLTDVVREFNQKVLTYSEDVLPAFSGIQSMLHRTYPGGLIFGHPEFFFDIALAWANVSDIIRRTPSSNFQGNSLEDKLPSWSWMGWHGDMCFPFDLEFHSDNSDPYGFLEPVTTWFTMESPTSLLRRRIESRWFGCKESTSDTSAVLPEGWTSSVYLPPKWLKRRDRHQVPQLPRELPPTAYFHVSDPGTQYWYPVPVLNFKDTPDLRKQTQYLYCETSRAYLYAGHGLIRISYKDDILIEDKDGNLAGVLFLHREDDRREFIPSAQPVRIELVAITKGWTKTLKAKSSERSTSDIAEDGQLTTNDGEDLAEVFDINVNITNEPKPTPSNGEALMPIAQLDAIVDLATGANIHATLDTDHCAASGAHDNGSSDAEDSVPDDPWWAHLDSDDERPEYWKDDKEDCYFVLWIKWNNGIAYRQASGCVLATAWDKYKEQDPVELILG